MDDSPQMCAFLCTRLRGFPFCNNPSASFADTSPSQGRGGFYKKIAAPPQELHSNSHTGEAWASCGPPCAKGDVGGADRGIVPFTTPPSASLPPPLHKEGEAFYKNIAPPPQELHSNSRTGEAQPQKGSLVQRELAPRKRSLRDCSLQPLRR